jgi:hypothetical protein
MSEILQSNNSQLYIELGLQDLVAGQTFDEDPVLSEKKGAPPYGEDEFIEFFKDREFDGSPSQGYLIVAETFTEDLHTMLEHIQATEEEPEAPHTPLVIQIATSNRYTYEPLTEVEKEQFKYALKNEKLYKAKETAASHAFRGQVDYLLHTKVLSTDSEENQRGRTLYSGRYYDRNTRRSIPLFLLESRREDEEGEYTTLRLLSRAPKDMLASPANSDGEEQLPYYPTGETEAQVLDLYEETISKIATAPVDEAEIVRGWIHRQAA